MPVSRPPLPPQLPEHPELVLAVRALDRMIEQLEERRQHDSDLAIAIGTMSRKMKEEGIFDIETLPPLVRRATENFLFTLVSTLRGAGPNVQRSVMRACYMAVRTTAEAYELEGAPGDLPGVADSA